MTMLTYHLPTNTYHISYNLKSCFPVQRCRYDTDLLYDFDVNKTVILYSPLGDYQYKKETFEEYFKPRVFFFHFTERTLKRYNLRYYKVLGDPVYQQMYDMDKYKQHTNFIELYAQRFYRPLEWKQ